MGSGKFFLVLVEGVLIGVLGWVFDSEWCFMLCLACVSMLVSVKLQHGKREVSDVADV
jgi:hypothetical protein